MQVVSEYGVKCIVACEARNFAAGTEAGWCALYGGMSLVLSR